MANTLNIGGGGSVTDSDLAAALEDELLNLGFTQGGGGALPYKEYAAIINQSSTNNPSIIELYNSYDGEITMTRNQAGVYSINSSEAGDFIEGETLVFITNGQLTGLVMSYWEESILYLNSSDIADPEVGADNRMFNCNILIRNYTA